jgi:hypothetical protein
MARETILYISDCETFTGSVFVALEATGYQVVSTQGSTQAMAMEYVLHSVVAVLLHHRTESNRALTRPKV